MSVAPVRAPDPADEAFSAAVAAITSAFGDSTRRQIYLYAKDAGRAGGVVTAGEVGRRFAVHANVARHHLDKLAAGGYLDVSVEHAGTAVGRPSKRYRASSRDVPFIVPPPRDHLLVTLLSRAISMLDPVEAECMAELVGEDYGRSLAEQIAPADSQRSMRAAMQNVADALTAHGFAAHAEIGDVTTSIVAEHCPFGDAAIHHPVICAVDRGMVRGMLAGLCGGAVPVRMSSRARGDDTCSAIAG